MGEYRLEELSQISGVSPRNIRAYRERGLLDAPRRAGRLAYYSDLHLAQLQTINQLHRRGFSSAHIAEFFAGIRQGQDLADLLGLRRVVAHTDRPRAPSHPAALDPAADETRRLIEWGLAEVADGTVVLADRATAQLIYRAPDPPRYARAVVHLVDSTRKSLDQLIADVIEGLEDCISAWFGPNHPPGDTGELVQALQDYREVAETVLVWLIDRALRQRMASTYPAGKLLDSGTSDGATP